MSFSWLPKVLREIAEVGGLEAALKLAQARGGTEIYIPAHAGADHWLTVTVGRKAADLICSHFAGSGGVRLELPLGPAGSVARIRADVDRLIAEGRSEREIALATGYTGRGVRRRKARQCKEGDGRQGRLF